MYCLYCTVALHQALIKNTLMLDVVFKTIALSLVEVEVFTPADVRGERLHSPAERHMGHGGHRVLVDLIGD